MSLCSLIYMFLRGSRHDFSARIWKQEETGEDSILSISFKNARVQDV